jgi:cytochrome bd-I ubiquinol oxidase subunit X
MWYFSWVLGTGLALAFGVLNAIWYEVMEGEPVSGAGPQPQGTLTEAPPRPERGSPSA